MPVITIPDDAYYVVISCVPDGERTQVRVEFDDALDHAAALVAVEHGRAVLAEQKRQIEESAGRERLLRPRVSEEAAHVAI